MIHILYMLSYNELLLRNQAYLIVGYRRLRPVDAERAYIDDSSVVPQ
jgi:hypothetical protein